MDTEDPPNPKLPIAPAPSRPQGGTQGSYGLVNTGLVNPTSTGTWTRSLRVFRLPWNSRLGLAGTKTLKPGRSQRSKSFGQPYLNTYIYIQTKTYTTCMQREREDTEREREREKQWRPGGPRGSISCEGPESTIMLLLSEIILKGMLSASILRILLPRCIPSLAFQFLAATACLEAHSISLFSHAAAGPRFPNHQLEHTHPKGPISTTHLRTPVPSTIPRIAVGTRVLLWAVYGPLFGFTQAIGMDMQVRPQSFRDAAVQRSGLLEPLQSADRPLSLSSKGTPKLGPCTISYLKGT